MAYETLWTCPECKTRGLLVSTHQYCPACGAEQGLSDHYTASNAEQAAAENHPYVGRDLACLVCQTLNARAANNCAGCGCSLAGAREMPAPSASSASMSSASLSSASMSSASMSSSSMSRSSMSRSDLSRTGMSSAALKGRDPHPSESTRARIASEQSITLQRLSEVSREAAADEAERTQRRMALLLVLAAVLAVIYYLRSREPELHAELVSHSWSRTIEIEQFREAVESAPCDRPPPNAQRIGQRGASCRFRYSAWQVMRSEVAEGEQRDAERSWPESRLRWTGQGNCEGCEREGARYEQFTLSLIYRGQITTCEVAQSLWETYDVGAKFTTRDDPATGGLDCNTLIPK